MDGGRVSMPAVHAVRHGDHFELELCRTQPGNPLDDALIAELSDALHSAAALPGCRAVLISATGQHFCRGLDLGRVPERWYAEPAAMPPWRMFCLLREVPVVTVALVDGQATGGGVALAAACDLVVAGQDASFRFTELLLGLVPGLAFPFVADRTGVQHAWRLALTASRTGQDEALRIGLADFACPSARGGTREVLTMLRRTTPETVRAMKRLRDRLYPRPCWLADVAGQATTERLLDPQACARIAGFRAAGVLS